MNMIDSTIPSYAQGKDWILYAGECSQVMKAMIPDESIDLIVTSPPYDDLRPYDGYEFDFAVIAGELVRAIKPGGVIVWVVGDATTDGSETGSSFRQALHFMECGLKLHDTMIYQKQGNGAPQARPYIRYSHCHEYMFVFSKGRPATFNPIMIYGKNEGMKYRTKRQKSGGIHRGFYDSGSGCPKINVWKFSPDQSTAGTDGYHKSHMAVFPEALARDHILSWSNPGDTVLDPFVGSGTTCKMALANGRKAIGIDISPEYLDIAIKRIGTVERQPRLIPIEQPDTEPEREQMRLTI